MLEPYRRLVFNTLCDFKAGKSAVVEMDDQTKQFMQTAGDYALDQTGRVRFSPIQSSLRAHTATFQDNSFETKINSDGTQTITEDQSEKIVRILSDKKCLEADGKLDMSKVQDAVGVIDSDKTLSLSDEQKSAAKEQLLTQFENFDKEPLKTQADKEIPQLQEELDQLKETKKPMGGG